MVKLTEVLVLSKAKASRLHNVRKLNLWACELTDVSVLRKMPNLTVATLSSNHISTLADIAYCTNLEELYIRCNVISTLSELVHLKSLNKLRVLWLEGNPCTKYPEYRLNVLHVLPHLHRLDNIVVENDELVAASQLPLECSGFGDVITDSKLASKKSPADTANTLFEDILVSNVVASTSELSRNKSQPELCKNDVSRVVSTTVLPSSDTQQLATGLRSKNHRLPLSSNDESQTVGSDHLNMATIRPHPQSSMANILQAVLCLLSELEHDNLEIVADAVRSRLSSL
jgi:hypothetical protein